MVTRSVNLEAPAPQRPPGDLLYAAHDVPGVARLNETTGLLQSYNGIDVGATATLPCPVSNLAAPVQTASSTSTTGGALAAGTYRAVITAFNPRGETTKSNNVTAQTTTGATSTVTFNWNAVTGATGYKIYITAVNGAVGTETYTATLGAVTTFVHDGSPAPDGTTAPPTTNTAVVQVTKTFDTADWSDAFAFAVYTGVKCKSFSGLDMDEVRAVFEATESRGVEKALLATRFVDGGTASWDAAVDLTPAGGAVPAAVAMSILEGYMSKVYASVPVLHMPRTLASQAAREGGINTMGTTFTSNMGSLVAAGSGYEAAVGAVSNTGPTGAVGAAGELWMYASGGVFVQRGEVVVADQLERSTNESFALVERSYVVTVDGPTYAVKAKVNP